MTGFVAIRATQLGLYGNKAANHGKLPLSKQASLQSGHKRPLPKICGWEVRKNRTLRLVPKAENPRFKCITKPDLWLYIST